MNKSRNDDWKLQLPIGLGAVIGRPASQPVSQHSILVDIGI